MSKPYCEAQVGGMECGSPVEKWGQQCEYHDPKRITVATAPTNSIEDQYKCQSYYDDNNVLKDCTCGKCGSVADQLDEILVDLNDGCEGYHIDEAYITEEALAQAKQALLKLIEDERQKERLLVISEVASGTYQGSLEENRIRAEQRGRLNGTPTKQ